MTFPTRSEIEHVLVALVDGTMSPEAADRWAAPFVVDESTPPAHMDDIVWNALGHLYGADIMEAPGVPLHGPADFTEWLADFRQRRAAH